MVEYALILVLVAVVVVLVLSTLGNTIKDTFQDVINGLQTK
jgi:Flp pilus assembly pilin Flp